MKVTGIKESGSNRLLITAIKQSLANNSIPELKSDDPIKSLINDSLFYHVKLSEVNHFELFRLSQVFRNKLRILNSYEASIPDLSRLREIFPGISESDENNGEGLPLAETCHFVISNLFNLISQMESDDDIISEGTSNLFIPMISRFYDVQIPISFIDFIESMNDEELIELFDDNYPNNLDLIISKDIHSVKTMISIGFVKLTSIIKYNTRYDKLLNDIIYKPLKVDDSNNIYKLAPLSFEKYDDINRGIESCMLYLNTPEEIEKSMRKISRINNPLEINFVVQLPIYHMQMISSFYDNIKLPIQYNSTMSTIINNGLIFDDFKTCEFVNDDSEEGQLKLHQHEEGISSYRQRINEANSLLLNTISILIKSKSDINSSDIFSLLPPIYKTTAVIKYNTKEKYQNNIHPIINSMFNDMAKFASDIIEDLGKYK